MWKKLLITLALGAVLDLLIAFGEKMKANAASPEGYTRWDVFVQCLQIIRNNQSLLNNN